MNTSLFALYIPCACFFKLTLNGQDVSMTKYLFPDREQANKRGNLTTATVAIAVPSWSRCDESPKPARASSKQLCWVSGLAGFLQPATTQWCAGSSFQHLLSAHFFPYSDHIATTVPTQGMLELDRSSSRAPLVPMSARNNGGSRGQVPPFTAFSQPVGIILGKKQGPSAGRGTLPTAASVPHHAW